jgi:hypothetical protein
VKTKASKLDAYAERLQEWFLAGKTLAEAQELLAAEGCGVSLGRLSVWWASRQRARMEEGLLAQIASGARACKIVEAEYEKNPEPRLKTIIALLKTLIMKVSTQPDCDPSLLKLVVQLLQPVLEFSKLEAKNQDLSLAREKFEFNAASACLAVLPSLKVIATDTGLSEVEKVQQIRLKLFGAAPG